MPVSMHHTGRRTRLRVALTPEDRATLEAWQRATTLPAALARRGRLLLLLAAGLSITAVALRVGLSRGHVYKWVRRFQAQGIAGLTEPPRHRAQTREEMRD
jgi:CRP-like cAMP-binding protein